MMKYTIVLVLFSLTFIRCDFADKRLSFINHTGSNVIVESVFFENKSLEGISCTRNLVRANSEQVLELLNNEWEMYFNDNKNGSFLEVRIIEAPESEFNPDNRIHEYLEHKIYEKNYFKIELDESELNKINWKIEYP